MFFYLTSRLWFVIGRLVSDFIRLGGARRRRRQLPCFIVKSKMEVLLNDLITRSRDKPFSKTRLRDVRWKSFYTGITREETRQLSIHPIFWVVGCLQLRWLLPICYAFHRQPFGGLSVRLSLPYQMRVLRAFLCTGYSHACPKCIRVSSVRSSHLPFKLH